MPESHSRDVHGGRGHWWTERLWVAAADLPVEVVAIDAIAEFDMDCWFGGKGRPAVWWPSTLVASRTPT